jgi:DNA-directed RNA polymerase subunit H (RpoH/RPB5)
MLLARNYRRVSNAMDTEGATAATEMWEEEGQEAAAAIKLCFADAVLNYRQIAELAEGSLHTIVVCNGVTRNAATRLAAAKEEDEEEEEEKRIEVFGAEELLCDPRDSALVPEHKRLAPGSAKLKWLEETFKLSDLPAILTSDPVAKFMGLRPGDVVMILRPINRMLLEAVGEEEEPGFNATYRICCKK